MGMNQSGANWLLIISGILGTLCILGLCAAAVFFAIERLEPSTLGMADSACPEIPTGWVMVATDTFDVNVNRWPEWTDEDTYMEVNWRVSQGEYQAEAYARQGAVSMAYPMQWLVEDFYLSADLQAEGAADSYYGVVFHLTHYNRYFFAISGTQEYTLFFYKNGWSQLLDWTESSAIQPGEVNRITVLGEGSHYTFCINGQYVDDIYDDQKPKGYIGFMFGLENAEDEALFRFDNFELWTP